jgi:integrase
MRVSVSKRAEFCVFKVSNSPYWQAKFYDYEKGIYACRKSTGVKLDKPKREAEKVARQLLGAGVLTASNNSDIGFIDYLQNFWKADGDYCRKAASVKGKPISPTYIKNNLGDIRLHIATYPPFEKMKLADVTTGDLERWQLWAREAHGITGNRANACLKLIKIALSQAAKRGDTKGDVSKAVTRAADDAKEKGILTQAEAAAVCSLPMDNPRRLLPVLLGLCCGMRRGEVRGLQWADIQDGLIDIRHNYIDGEGLKSPKCGSFRKVPYGAAVAACIDAVRATARHTGENDFVLESLRIDGEPVTENHFRQGLTAVLSSIGITPEQQRARNITPHSLRHSFISLARLAGVSDIEVQTLAGHSDIGMTDHYTHAGQAMDYEAVRAKFSLVA